MSNRPRRRRRGGLHLPRSAWPIMCTFAATDGRAPASIDQAIATASTELASRLTGTTQRSEIRAITVDSDEARACLGDLGVNIDDRPDLRDWCAEHPAGRLVIAYADYQPDTRRTQHFG